MVKLERHYPFGRKLLLFGIYDILERMKAETEYDEKTGRVTCTLDIYEQRSVFTFETHQAGDGSSLTLELLVPAAALSEKGQERALRFLADSIDQHVENTLEGREIPKPLRILE